MRMKLFFSLMFLLVLTGFVFAAFDFENGVSGESETTFITSGGAPICVVDANNAKWDFFVGEDILVVVNGVTPATISATKGCYQSIGLPSTTCCIQGTTCDVLTGRCEEDDSSDEATNCAFYDGTTEEICETANLENVKDSIYGVFRHNLETQLSDDSQIPSIGELTFCDADGQPQIFTLDGQQRVFGACGCVWQDNSCKSSYQDTCLDCEPTGDDIFQCVTTLTPLENMCETEGVYKVSWTAVRNQVDASGNIIGAGVELTSDCQEGDSEFECPETSALPFFTFFNLVISAFAIGIFYFLFRKRFE